MRRILVLAQRDFLASIRSKGFIIGIIVFPILFGGSFAVIALTQRVQNEQVRRVAIWDRTGQVAAALVRTAQERNERDMFDRSTGRQVMPRYVFEVVPDSGGDPRLALSDRVRRRELYAFVDIGPEALNPEGDPSKTEVASYSSSGGIDQFRAWFSGPLNNALRQVRLSEAGLDADRSRRVLREVTLQDMSLVAKDSRTGAALAPRKKSIGESFAIPYIFTFMMAMIVMMGSAPMLTSVAEDKIQRVYEMLLSVATPFELMMGKVLSGVGRALLSSAFYIAGGILMLQGLAMFGLVPFGLIPWFFAYLVAEVILISSVGVALGSGCGSPQDAQPLNFIVVLPIMFPIFLFAFIMQQPDSAASTALSFIPPFTPMLMLLRQSLPGGVPAWQPWVGLLDVVLCACAVTWVAARIFRVGVLFHGASPKLAQILRWAVRG
ncbi:MAG: ABC transporter permease [Acidobacteriia bacterium]|nr:ABC transporter permease [Terriglobia bacterium]